jgi:hypothetical protein
VVCLNGSRGNRVVHFVFGQQARLAPVYSNINCTTCAKDIALKVQQSLILLLPSGDDDAAVSKGDVNPDKFAVEGRPLDAVLRFKGLVFRKAGRTQLPTVGLK